MEMRLGVFGDARRELLMLRSENQGKAKKAYKNSRVLAFRVLGSVRRHQHGGPRGCYYVPRRHIEERVIGLLSFPPFS